MPLRVIEFQLLQKCNAQCLYCAYEQNASKEEGFFPLSLIDSTLADSLPEWVWFEGGEVTISDKSKEYLLEAMAIANKHGVKIRINTNAQNVNPQWAKRLAEGGLKYACVSFDSLNTETYAKLRGYDVSKAAERHEDLKRNAIGLADAGVTVNLEATLTRHNIGELLDLYDFTEKLARPGREILMGIQFLVATYDEIFDIAPTIQKANTALMEVIQRAKKGKIPLRICCCSLVPCEYPEIHEPHENIIMVGCSCGFDHSHIHASGDVFLCGFWDHSEPIGNLHKSTFRDIWETSPLRANLLNTQPDKCVDCDSWEGKVRCRNTCPSVVKRKTGGFSELSYPLLQKMIVQSKKKGNT